MGSGSPNHLLAYYYAAQGVLSRHPWERMQPRDSYVINDPYLGGMQHVPDLAVITPVFWEGRPLGFCATIAHKSDMGGIVPGSSGAASREIYHEGLLIPGIKYWTADGPVADAVAVVMRNSRTPELVAGDIRAQIGSTRMEQRLHTSSLQQYGFDDASSRRWERLQEISYDRMGDDSPPRPDGVGEGRIVPR